MKSEFENSIKRSSSYEKLVYQHGERLFIFDDGKYKIAAIQLAWEIFKEKHTKVDELQKKVDAVKQLIQEYRDPPTEDKTFCHALSIVAYELERVLKGNN